MASDRVSGPDARRNRALLLREKWHWRRAPHVMLVAMLAALTLSSAGAHDVAELPDLVPADPYHIWVGPGLLEQGPAIRFTVVSENRGAYPLDVVSNPGGVDADGLATGQCVQWETVICTERRPVQPLVWDPTHEHFHFPNFALYEVRKLTADGNPDLRPSGLVASRRKVSFCLEDSRPNQEDTSFKGYLQVGVYSGCSDIYQGISAGWGDEYLSGLAGQEIPIVDIPDGSYALVVTLNTDGLLYETTRANNMSFERFTLRRYGPSGSHAEATVP